MIDSRRVFGYVLHRSNHTVYIALAVLEKGTVLLHDRVASILVAESIYRVILFTRRLRLFQNGKRRSSILRVNQPRPFIDRPRREFCRIVSSNILNRSFPREAAAGYIPVVEDLAGMLGCDTVPFFRRPKHFDRRTLFGNISSNTQHRDDRAFIIPDWTETRTQESLVSLKCIEGFN